MPRKVCDREWTTLSSGRRIQVGESLGFKPGQVVQEFYFDEDVDNSLRAAVEKEVGGDLVAWDYPDMVDGVVIWWREEDAFEEDLEDVLVDASANLDDAGGVIYVLTPKPGRKSSVAIDQITEAAKTAGLKPTTATSVAPDWSGMRLVARPRQR